MLDMLQYINIVSKDGTVPDTSYRRVKFVGGFRRATTNTKACQNCYKRKIMCDGTKPTCMKFKRTCYQAANPPSRSSSIQRKPSKVLSRPVFIPQAVPLSSSDPEHQLTSVSSHVSQASVGKSQRPAQWVCSEQKAHVFPQYCINQAEPVHPVVLNLCKNLFKYAACHFGFFEEVQFLRSVRDRTAETILVNAVCAVALTLPDRRNCTSGSSTALHVSKVEYVSVLQAKVTEAADMLCSPLLCTVQALVVIAYGALGADQIMSAHTYLKKATSIAASLDFKAWCNGWESLLIALLNSEAQDEPQDLSQTLQALFILERAASSIQPQLFDAYREGLALKDIQPVVAHTNDRSIVPDRRLRAVFLAVLDHNRTASHLFEELSNTNNLTNEVWDQIFKLEGQLLTLYTSWDTAGHMVFHPSNLRCYITRGQGMMFVLVHLWLHVLFIKIYQHMSTSDTRHLTRISAIAVHDILVVTEAVDVNCLSSVLALHPADVATRTFSAEADAMALDSYFWTQSPLDDALPGMQNPHMPQRHPLLVSATTRRLKVCYTMLQKLSTYWEGVKFGF